MEGPEIAENQALGAEVRRVLAERGLSDRGAAIKTGLARNTIDALKRGVNVNRTTIYKWAKSINEPVNKWLALAGYSHIADTSESPLPAAGFSYCPSPPPEVSEAIQAALAAKNVDEAVEEAFYFVRRPEHRRILNFKAGASGGDTRPGKIAIIRAFEHLAGVELLPKEILF